MSHSTAGTVSPGFIRQEIQSESTLPLLSFLISYRFSDDNLSKIFEDVKSQIGRADRPIPDESEQLRTSLINLINSGPGKDGEDLLGRPTVSMVSEALIRLD